MINTEKRPNYKRFLNQFSVVMEPLLILLTAFVFISLLLVMAGVTPHIVYYHIFIGAFGSWTKFAHVLNVWVPLTLCALGLLYTFKIGLWNIGVEGQVMMGAVFTTAVIHFSLPGPLSIPSEWLLVLSFLGGIVGGGIWALGVAVLKIKGKVNEIFSGLGLNFVAQGTILWLVFGPWKRPGVASMSGTEPFPPEFWLPYLSGVRLSPIGIVIVFLVLLVTVMFLNYMRIGLAFKAVGGNPNAAYLFGLKPNRNLMLAMLFAGGIAGLAGSIQVTGVYHRLLPSISSNYGYLALLVVMLSNYRIWLTPFIAFFFAGLNAGSIQLPMVLELDSSLSGVIQGILVLLVLGMNAWRTQQKTHRITSFISHRLCP